jgi:hypothetical protein
LVSSSESRSIDPKDRPVEVLSQPNVQEVPEVQANVIVDVTNVSVEPARTSIRLGDDLAFDCRTPSESA